VKGTGAYQSQLGKCNPSLGHAEVYNYASSFRIEYHRLY